MEFKEIQDLLKLVNKTDLSEVEIEKKDFKLKIRRKEPENNVIYATTPSAQVPPLSPVIQSPTSPIVPMESESELKTESQAAESQEASKNLHTFKSPMIGTFYRAPNPGADPYVKVGDIIRKGQVLCIVEAMKLFNEIESEVDGKIVKILLEDAHPVEYDQPLFLVDLDA